MNINLDAVRAQADDSREPVMVTRRFLREMLRIIDDAQPVAPPLKTISTIDYDPFDRLILDGQVTSR